MGYAALAWTKPHKTPFPYRRINGNLREVVVKPLVTEEREKGLSHILDICGLPMKGKSNLVNPIGLGNADYITFRHHDRTFQERGDCCGTETANILTPSGAVIKPAPLLVA